MTLEELSLKHLSNDLMHSLFTEYIGLYFNFCGVYFVLFSLKVVSIVVSIETKIKQRLNLLILWLYSCQARPQFQLQLKLNRMGPELTLILVSDPPHPTPLHPPLHSTANFSSQLKPSYIQHITLKLGSEL